MKLYADAPARRWAQIGADVIIVVWVAVWIRVGLALHAATLRLSRPGQQMESAGTGIGANLREASAQVSGVPLVGDKLRSPFDAAGRAAASLTTAGQEQQRAVAHLAVVLGLAVALIPILVAVAYWLPRRVRFVVAVRAAKRFIDADADLDLFALRAMSRQPMAALARIDADPVAAWRRGDRDVVRALAALELRSVGLAPPP